MPQSIAMNTKNRAIRQAALREQLANGKHVEHVIDIASRLSNESIDLDAAMVTRLKAAADIKCKLISKYLPDLKAVEVTGEDGEAIQMVNVIRIVAGDGSDSQATA